MKILLPIMLGCLSLSTLPLRAADEKTEETAKSSVTLDQFKLGETIFNEAVTMDSLKGKVVVIEWWGIHCGPCIAAMPHLVSLQKRNDDKGLAVIGFHCQDATDEEVQAKAKSMKLNFPVTKGGNGPREGNGIPYSQVFDTAGNLVFEGRPTDAGFEKAVKKSLKEVSAAGSSSSGLGPKPGGSSLSPSSSSKPAKPSVLIAERPWTNTDGKVMNAALVSVSGDNATFKKKDGKTFVYPLSKLNEEDQATIKEAAAKATEAPAE